MNNRLYLIVIPIALTGIVLTILAFNTINHHERDVLYATFNIAAANRIEHIEDRINLHLSSVNVIKALFESQQTVSRDNFKKFVAPILEQNPAIRALEWIPKVSFADRQGFEEKARHDGYEGFHLTELSPDKEITRALERAFYFPVYYVEPYSGNERVLGFDLGSNPVRLTALETARDSGKITLSEPITLVQSGKTGILVFNPIYRGETSLDTVQQRQDNLHGYALGVIQIDKMIISANSSRADITEIDDIDFYLYNSPQTQSSQLIYLYNAQTGQNGTAPQLGEADMVSSFNFKRVIPVGQDDWLIVAKPNDPSKFSKTGWQAWLAIFTGSILTCLVCLTLASNINRRAKVEKLVEIRTQELENTKNRVLSIIENTSEGVITINRMGIIETVNSATEAMFKYQRDEMIGHNIKMLLPATERGAHDGYLAQSDRLTSRVINQARDLYGCRKDGTLFPMELVVSIMEHDGEKNYIGILHDITERKEVEKAKHEFVSTVSHELRTPVTAIKGALGLLRGGAIGDIPEKMYDMLNIAYTNSDRLVLLINDILDVEKLEAGKMDMKMMPVDMGELLKKAIVNNEAYGKMLHVNYHLSNIIDGIQVLGNADRLMQVLTNLMSNAAKFSPENSSVELSMTNSGDNVCIRVQDHGCGIPPEFEEKIFTKFSQADSSTTRAKGGTGLGLNISKSIIERHGGKIDFETELGSGTVFYFSLPTLET